MNRHVLKNLLNKKRTKSGFTLVELLITVSIIAALSAIAITQISGVLPTARQTAAGDTAALLNAAVNHYDQVNSEITVAAANDTTDEVAVVALLKMRSASSPGSPYVQANISIMPTSDTDKVRLYWTGKFFKSIPEGTAGTGIAVNQ